MFRIAPEEAVLASSKKPKNKLDIGKERHLERSPMADAIKHMRSLRANPMAELKSLRSNPHAELMNSLRSNPMAELKSLRSNPHAELMKSLRSNPMAELKSLRSNPWGDLTNQLDRINAANLLSQTFDALPVSARALAALAESEGSLKKALAVIADAVRDARDVPNEPPDNASEIELDNAIEAFDVLPVSVDNPEEASEWLRGFATRLHELAQRHPILLAIALNLISNFISDGIKWWAASFPTESIQAETYRERKKTLQGSTSIASRDVRMVSKHQTRVWRDKKRKSGFKYRLHRGQVVILLERRAKWSRIGFGDALRQSSEVGWVKNKYLERLQLP